MGTRVPGARAPGRDDHPLLRSLSAGDESAFWTLWQQYQRHLYAVCLRQMSGDQSEADDAVSRSMMVARDRLPEHAQRIENLEAWLTRLTCNVCLDIHRERRRLGRGAINIDADGPFVPPTASYYPQVDRAITKYPYDPQRVAQLMSEAGITKAADGFYQSAGEGHLRWEIKTSASVDNEAETSIMANTWRQAGFDFQQAVLPAALAQDGQARATFPTLYSFGTSVGEPMLAGMNTAGISRPENRFSGSNRGGWSNGEFDILSDTLGQTLDPDRRAQVIAQMTAMVSREAVTIPLYFYGNPVAATSAVVGPSPVVQETPFEWNIYEWQIAR